MGHWTLDEGLSVVLKLLWKYSVDIVTVGNALTNNQGLVLVYRDSDSVTADANLALIRITGHALNLTPHASFSIFGASSSSVLMVRCVEKTSTPLFVFFIQELELFGQSGLF